VPLVAAILPSSRSVRVDTPATVFATVINAGTTTAPGVGISLATPIPAALMFQTTDPKTNVVTGLPNTPVDIAPQQSQTYVIALTPTTPMFPTDVAFALSGGNFPTISGIDTLLLSASATPVPDIVALVATVNNDGIVDIPGPTGIGFFAVATVNVGSGANVMVFVTAGFTNPSSPLLPVDLEVGGTPDVRLMRPRSPARPRCACDPCCPVGRRAQETVWGQARRKATWGERDPEWTAGDDAGPSTTSDRTERSTPEPLAHRVPP
jgi:hypothetical protein